MRRHDRVGHLERADDAPRVVLDPLRRMEQPAVNDVLEHRPHQQTHGEPAGHLQRGQGAEGQPERRDDDRDIENMRHPGPHMTQRFHPVGLEHAAGLVRIVDEAAFRCRLRAASAVPCAAPVASLVVSIVAVGVFMELLSSHLGQDTARPRSRARKHPTRYTRPRADPESGGLPGSFRERKEALHRQIALAGVVAEGQDPGCRRAGRESSAPRRPGRPRTRGR